MKGRISLKSKMRGHRNRCQPDKQTLGYIGKYPLKKFSKKQKREMSGGVSIG